MPESSSLSLLGLESKEAKREPLFLTSASEAAMPNRPILAASSRPDASNRGGCTFCGAPAKHRPTSPPGPRAQARRGPRPAVGQEEPRHAAKERDASRSCALPGACRDLHGGARNTVPVPVVCCEPTAERPLERHHRVRQQPHPQEDQQRDQVERRHDGARGTKPPGARLQSSRSTS